MPGTVDQSDPTREVNRGYPCSFAKLVLPRKREPRLGPRLRGRTSLERTSGHAVSSSYTPSSSPRRRGSINSTARASIAPSASMGSRLRGNDGRGCMQRDPPLQGEVAASWLTEGYRPIKSGDIPPSGCASHLPLQGRINEKGRPNCSGRPLSNQRRGKATPSVVAVRDAGRASASRGQLALAACAVRLTRCSTYHIQPGLASSPNGQPQRT